MLGRFFTRNSGVCCIITGLVFLLLFVYEMKHLYNKFQKGMRFAYYNTYVNEVYHFADKLQSSQVRTSEQVKHLSKAFKLAFKRNTTDVER